VAGLGFAVWQMTLWLLSAFFLLTLNAELCATPVDALPDVDSPSSIGWLLLTLAGLAVALNQVLGAILTMRKLKGADASADSRYASTERVNHIETNVNEMRGEVKAIQVTLNNELCSIHRCLGRIEEHLSMSKSKSQ
jgi:uncharacterized OsmC-like protein